MPDFKKPNPKLQNRPWLMNIKPLWLREKIFWKLYANKTAESLYLFEKANLELAPHIFLKLMPTDIAHKAIAFCGFWELEVSRRIAKLAQGGGLMVDGGANYGYYSCLWASAGIKNRVVAFEASPRNFSALKLNLINNNLQSQVDVHDIAIGKETGRLPFALGPDEQSGWGGLLVNSQTSTIEVPVVSLDDFFIKGESERINVLKIDTEGADTWVLQGAKELLRTHKISHIFFEENAPRMSALGIEPGEAKNLLQNCGYYIENLGGGEWYACIK